MPIFKYLYGINTKTLKLESLNSSYLWHSYLGHISDKRVCKLHKFGNLRSFDYESYDTCESFVSQTTFDVSHDS